MRYIMGERFGVALALVAAGLLSGIARAEVDSGSINQLSGATVLGGDSNQQGNAIADRMSQGMMVDPNTIVDKSAENAKNGREYKAGDAERQANAGKAAAIAAGTAMIATGTPMLASPIASVRAAGMVLITKGGIEFVQAAAMAKAAKENKAQKDMLLAKAGQDGEQSKGQQAQTGGDAGQETKQQIAQQLAQNPQLNNLLSNRGVNAEDFANRLANGELTNPQDVARAMGDTEVTAEDFAKGEVIAAQQYAASPEPRGKADTLRVLNDDSAKPRDADTKGATVAYGGGTKPEASDKERPSSAKGDLGGPIDSPAAAAAAAANGKGIEPGRNPSLAALMGHDPALVAELMGALGLGNGGNGAPKTLPDRAELARLGIMRLPPRQNIFQLSHRNYRSFQKWRRQAKAKTRIAKR